MNSVPGGQKGVIKKYIAGSPHVVGGDGYWLGEGSANLVNQRATFLHLATPPEDEQYLLEQFGVDVGVVLPAFELSQ